MTGWNLPPGCTDRDIDLASGAIVQCTQCGKDIEPTGDEEDDEEVLCANCATIDDQYEAYRERRAEERAEWLRTRLPESD